MKRIELGNRISKWYKTNAPVNETKTQVEFHGTVRFYIYMFRASDKHLLIEEKKTISRGKNKIFWIGKKKKKEIFESNLLHFRDHLKAIQGQQIVP